MKRTSTFRPILAVAAFFSLLFFNNAGQAQNTSFSTFDYQPEFSLGTTQGNIFASDNVLNLNGSVSFYKLQEGTKNEYATIDPGGYVRRWADKGNDNTQIWCVYPDNDANGSTKYRIQTLQNGEFMSIGGNGVAVRWRDKADNSQKFSFKMVSSGVYNIGEGTANENLSVGSTGEIRRWMPNAGNEQKWKLVPYNVKPKPTTLLMSAGKQSYKPGRIPQPARVTSMTAPVLATNAYLISEDIVPATLVNDKRYSTKMNQINDNPYYYLVREQYYEPEVIDLLPFSSQTTKTIQSRFFNASDIQSISESYRFGIEASLSVEGGHSAGDQKGKEVKGSGALKASYEQAKTILNQSGTSSGSQTTIEHTITFNSPEQQTRVIIWRLMDRYTIYDRNKTAIAPSWKNEFAQYYETFPALPVNLVR